MLKPFQSKNIPTTSTIQYTKTKPNTTPSNTSEVTSTYLNQKILRRIKDFTVPEQP